MTAKLEHEELEGTDKVSEWANAILRKPLQKFESSQWEAHRKEAHVNARALGYVRHLQKKQEKLNNSRYCVVVFIDLVLVTICVSATTSGLE
ncbi:MAG: hypothetical protein MHM6MM_009079 [Cercozoa sp. M6MM]